jgi:hypothetical protein
MIKHEIPQGADSVRARLFANDIEAGSGAAQLARSSASHGVGARVSWSNVVSITRAQ